MKKKVCKKCKLFVDGDTCPLCQSKDFSTNWQGKINFLDVNKSMIAKKMDVKVKGDYSIKVR